MFFKLFLIFSLQLIVVNSFTKCLQINNIRSTKLYNVELDQTNAWDGFDGFKCTVFKPLPSANNVYDDEDEYSNQYIDDYDQKKKDKYNLNVGKALETLRRELPLVFYVSDLDFSIFSNQITVSDANNQNKIAMQKQLYKMAVKSLKVAASLSYVCPSMNVKKIDYLEDCRTIQCLVDVVLPDTVRIDGQSSWEGMFYFGLDSEGLINTHVFDRKISNLRTQPLKKFSLYPWLQHTPSWSAELIQGVPVFRNSLVADQTNSQDL